MIETAAGYIAEGREHQNGSNEDDDAKMRSLTIEIHGKLATQKKIECEVSAAKKKAGTLVVKYRNKIEELAERLLDVYNVLDNLTIDRRI